MIDDDVSWNQASTGWLHIIALSLLFPFNCIVNSINSDIRCQKTYIHTVTFNVIYVIVFVRRELLPCLTFSSL